MRAIMMNPSTHAHLDVVKVEQCPKLSASAEGQITYHVYRNPQDNTLSIALTGNESGGYFSQEAVPMAKIDQCLQELLASGKPFPAVRLKHVFIGKSTNNPSFLAAVLRHEQLLMACPESPKLLLPAPGLLEWCKRMEAMPALSASPQEAALPVAHNDTAAASTKVAKSEGKKKHTKATEATTSPENAIHRESDHADGAES